MKKIYLLFVLVFVSLIGSAQIPVHQPKLMVVPYTKSGEDIRTILDNDVNGRIAITKVKEAFDAKGFNTVDFIGKLKAAKDNQVFTSDNQTDIKAKIIEMSGCDIYVIVEVDATQDNSGSGVSVILSAYDASTGNSVVNAVGNSGKFFTNDIAHLTSKAVEKTMDEFTKTINDKFAEIEKNGRSVLVDISFSENSTYNMTSPVGDKKMALSDALEDWFSKNSVNNNYHIQGTTDLKMIFDDVRIPVRDANGNNYSSNKFALSFFNYLTTLGLSPAKQIKSNTIYITIN